jgi:hypothetical protein
VAKSHSRPHVSNDNPYSEAHFKTLKCRPDYPDRFGSLADARHWARRFFAWYNDQHHHTGLGLLTPATVHSGRAETVRHKRQAVLQQAYQTHPERFVRGQPQPTKLPEAVWINPPPRPADLSAPAPQTATAKVPAALGADQLAPATALRYTDACGPEDRATLRKNPANPLSTPDSSAVRITHPAHPLCGQSFEVLPQNGGRPDPSYVLVMLPNGERRFIPLAWTDQTTQVNYPPGACFLPERLLVLRQRLDHLLVRVGEQAMLQAQHNECKEPSHDYDHCRANPLATTESRTTGPHHRASGADPAAPPGSTAGGGA